MNHREVISRLKQLGKNTKPGYKEGMARFGIESSNALGVPLPEIRKFAKEIISSEGSPFGRKAPDVGSKLVDIEIGKNHELALSLWQTNIHEAKTIATLIDDPKLVTENQMDDWANDFYSWDICDQCCSNLFDKTPFYKKKIIEWIKSEKEFVRRAGFVLMATSAVHDKKAPDAQFIEYLPLIKQYSHDKRNFVKKAVNWALRQIGKRNISLHKHALALAKELRQTEDKTARWIGSDAARELERGDLRIRH
ncbi:DNA alkylation repair protein [Candidatus Micrarchaeota archaeon]|nr:DNA alkylation repair protein [Candidatus Micrarchaeota archaeon]MBU1166025.1 DNA alkylation repair protein [Candidatus Micrarchaeota archaeon]MBU1886360.1 DNA alkylation repair protein [Candidatus Micrarchaeota archaeon]